MGPRSPAQPLRNITDHTPRRIAAGQNTSYILAHPNDKYSDLPRHPAEIDVPDFCFVCEKDNGDDDPLLECEKVRALGDRRYVLVELMSPRSVITLSISNV